MKIIQHTFTIDGLRVMNGELREVEKVSEEYTFSLLHKGFGLFESEYGSPLFTALMGKLKGINVEELDVSNEETITKILDILEDKFIKALACASYIKIENDEFHNNGVTCDEFKKTLAYQKVSSDIDFVTKLIQMIIESLPKSKAKKKQTGKKK